MKDYFYNYHLLSFGESLPEALKNGYYVDARFSWGSEPEELVRDLAEMLDCRLYDGQLDPWITRGNLTDIADGFARSARSIGALFGKVDKRKYRDAADKVLQDKGVQEKDYSV